jgi:hypothetical protein
MKYFGEEGKQILIDKLFYGSLPEFQAGPLLTLIDKSLEVGVKDIKQIAYILATAYHESNRFKAKEEYGKGKNKRYGSYNWLWNNKKERYHGRGWVQLTWLGNYGQMTAKLSAVLGKEIDLINNPDIILKDDNINAYIIVVGMQEGLFTGKTLSDYLGDDYIGARRIVNGTDKATLIAGYAKTFEEALRYG